MTLAGAHDVFLGWMAVRVRRGTLHTLQVSRASQAVSEWTWLTIRRSWRSIGLSVSIRQVPDRLGDAIEPVREACRNTAIKGYGAGVWGSSTHASFDS